MKSGKKQGAGAPEAREIKQSAVYVTAVDQSQGIVEAIVNVFGIIDEGGDMVQPGAFAKTISERGTKVRVLDQHGRDSVLRVVGKTLAMREVGRDELPAEIVTAYPEATGGLWTQAQYLLHTPEGKGVFDRIAAGAISEYSIGYDAVKVDWRAVTGTDGKKTNVRVLQEIRLWEYSPVIWGMNPATVTVGVKSDDDAPIEAKGAGTLGVALQAAIASEHRWMLARWLNQELIDLDEYGVISALLLDAARLVSDGMSDELRARGLPRYDEWMSADETVAEMKAGRVLSAKNYELINSAYQALDRVMSSAGMTESADTDAPKGDDQKTTSAEPGKVPLTRDEIERDLIEWELETIAWT